MKNIFLIICAALFLTACNDGVPSVKDPHHVEVDGEKMTQLAFLEKYCIGKTTSETCHKVKHAMIQDSTRGVVPRF